MERTDNSKETIFISQNCYDEILRTFLYNGYESAGVVGFRDRKIVWSRMIKGTATDVSFIPDPADLTKAYAELRKGGHTGWGILHSHSENEPLSPSDIRYAREILICNKIEMLPMIVLVGRELKAYTVTLKACCDNSVCIE